MCGSGAFDVALQHLGENSDKFMSNPTVEQLVATINTLSESPQPQGDVSPDFESVDPTQAFNLDDFVKDSGGFLPHKNANPSISRTSQLLYPSSRGTG